MYICIYEWAGPISTTIYTNTQMSVLTNTHAVSSLLRLLRPRSTTPSGHRRFPAGHRQRVQSPGGQEVAVGVATSSGKRSRRRLHAQSCRPRAPRLARAPGLIALTEDVWPACRHDATTRHTSARHHAGSTASVCLDTCLSVWRPGSRRSLSPVPDLSTTTIAIRARAFDVAAACFCYLRSRIVLWRPIKIECVAKISARRRRK